MKQNLGVIEKYHNIYIVYTKEAQTADMFIERTTHEMSHQYQISVVTSDALEQIIVMAKGASRISSREFVKEVEYLTSVKMKEYLEFFKYGCPSHGGIGFGIDRFIAKLLDLSSIKESIFIFRGTGRLKP